MDNKPAVDKDTGAVGTGFNSRIVGSIGDRYTVLYTAAVNYRFRLFVQALLQ